MKHTTTLAPLLISNTVYFKGTLEEIQEAERKEASRADEIERIITAPDFIALEYISYNGQRRILHRSTRPGNRHRIHHSQPGREATHTARTPPERPHKARKDRKPYKHPRTPQNAIQSKIQSHPDPGRAAETIAIFQSVVILGTGTKKNDSDNSMQVI